LSKPTKSGGLAYGDGLVATILLAFALMLVTFAAVRRPRRVGAWADAIAD
jgi:uncharacterized membrane-anchored protein